MILRFQHMLAIADKAEGMINRACRDLCGSSFTEFGELKRQFYIMPNLDVFIDDDMDSESSGYILKCLRAVGFLSEKAEVVVPNKHRLNDGVSLVDDTTSTIKDSDERAILSIEDYLPDRDFNEDSDE